MPRFEAGGALRAKTSSPLYPPLKKYKKENVFVQQNAVGIAVIASTISERTPIKLSMDFYL
jgi:hypothetical protein